MEEFKGGQVQILVCTDAAGMVSLMVLSLTCVLMLPRDATLLTLTLLSSGNFLDPSQLLCNTLGDVQEDRVVLAWQFY